MQPARSRIIVRDDPLPSPLRFPDPPRRRPLRRLRFGDFELASDSGELFRGGERVRLQPQPAKVLLYLAARPGELVERQRLQRHLWDEDHFVDCEQGLNYCIRAARLALGDDASAPRFIETVPRRGYRFARDVEIVEAAGPGLRAAEVPRRRPGIGGLLAAAAASFVLALLWTRRVP